MKGVMIKEIEHISEEAEEALVQVTDGIYECWAFCQPCDKAIGDVVEQPLLAFNTKGIEVLDSVPLGMGRIDSTLRYEICGTIIDLNVPLVSIGLILLELDIPLPGGIAVGSAIRFSCDRIDLF